MSGINAMVITASTTYVDAMNARRTPDLGAGLADVIGRIGMALAGEGTVLFDAEAAGKLGLPTGELPVGDECKRHPALEGLRAAGYHAKDVHRWTRLVKNGRELHIGLLEFIDQDRAPLVNANRLADTAAALAAWAVMSGVSYRGQAGDAGNALLRACARFKEKGRLVEPTWWAANGPEDAHESPYTLGDWRGKRNGQYLHGYDRVRAYLAAMTTAEVAGRGLVHTGRKHFDPKAAGWWLVELAPWQVEQLPDPAGYGEEGPRWVTTPTLRLVSELATEGIHGGFEVIDSWTSTAYPSLLKKYGTRLREMWDQAADLREAADRAAIRATVKAAYRQSYGMWSSTQTTVRRPDWAATVVATNRANLFRRIRKVGDATGRWPVAIDTDNIWYSSVRANPEEACPEGIELADKLGGFRITKTIDKGEDA